MNISKKVPSKKILGLVALTIVVCLYFLWPGHRRDNVSAESDTYKVIRGDIASKLRQGGTIEAIKTESVASVINGRNNEVLVKEGDFVQKGQVLIRFREEDLLSKLETERAKYIKAKSRLDEVKNWYSSSTFINAKTNLETSRASCEDAGNTYKQNQELFKAKAIAKQDMDKSLLEFNRARASLEGAQAQFEEAKIKGNADALKEAMAGFIADKIAFKDAEMALAQKDVRAPCSGVVSLRQGVQNAAAEKAVSLNRTVSPGEFLLTIADHDRLCVDCKVDEFDIYRIRLGQECKIIIPALSGEAFDGRVVGIAPQTSEKGTFFQVRSEIEKPSTLLKVGISATVEITFEEKNGVLVVPLSALVKQGGRMGVYLITGEKPQFTEVKIGLTDNDVAEVIDGLSEGKEILRRATVKSSEEG